MVRPQAKARKLSPGAMRAQPLYVQVLAHAEASLAQIPADGLTPQVAELRAQLVTGVSNMARIIQEAAALHRGAQVAFEGFIDAGNMDEAFAVVERLRATPQMDRLSKAYLGLMLMTSWSTSAYRSMLQAQQKGGGTG